MGRHSYLKSDLDLGWLPIFLLFAGLICIHSFLYFLLSLFLCMVVCLYLWIDEKVFWPRVYLEETLTVMLEMDYLCLRLARRAVEWPDGILYFWSGIFGLLWTNGIDGSMLMDYLWWNRYVDGFDIMIWMMVMVWMDWSFVFRIVNLTHIREA